MKPKAERISIAHDRLSRRSHIVKDAANTPQGRALLDLIEQEFGQPPIGGDSQFRAMANVGQAEVVTWLKQMEIYDK